MLVVCGAAVLLSPVWTEIAEHANLADLLEVASSNTEYLGRVVTYVMAVAEHAPSHAEYLRQPIAPFYSFGDRFVKYTLTPEAEPAVEPWLHSPIWAGTYDQLLRSLWNAYKCQLFT